MEELLESCHEHPWNSSMAKPAVTPHCSSYRNNLLLRDETFSNAWGFSEEKERAESRAHLQEEQSPSPGGLTTSLGYQEDKIL